MHASNQDGEAVTESWYLEGFAAEGKTWIINLHPLPFVIGRQEGCHLRLSFAEISRRHAEIYEQDDRLWIREFGSTNGTFVNRRRLQGELLLNSGDILHFGSLEFRIRRTQIALSPSGKPTSDITTSVPITELSQGFVDCEAEFNQMLSRQSVVPYFQPIVRLKDERVVAYELLGRGDFQGLPTSPGPLLQIAKSLGKEIELSELFRRAGIQHASHLGLNYRVFFNTLPPEMSLTFLRRSLQELRTLAPALPMAMEVHEKAVTDLSMMRELRELLDELSIKLVYDDFGAGQARLVELIEVPPDCLKFDISLVRNIHRQPPRSQQVMRTLVQMARDLGILTLAEGTEIKEEVDVCAQIGFELAQGYYFGKPEPDVRSHVP